ncbi:hypothetical protein [Aneurinibacillus tyrosinisolvens]|uniref:hypothetical protein n=1 Tax=Aneurinibacillus tyrosinisolvens TaxID=1443435 RepID=UPI00063FA5D1|nr:hypothetical protein [Aneurinibacillus tyrosinisolvens]
MEGDPQWHVGVDPPSAEAQVRGIAIASLAMAWGMNLYPVLFAVCAGVNVQRSLPCVVQKGLPDSGFAFFLAKKYDFGAA